MENFNSQYITILISVIVVLFGIASFFLAWITKKVLNMPPGSKFDKHSEEIETSKTSITRLETLLENDTISKDKCMACKETIYSNMSKFMNSAITTMKDDVIKPLRDDHEKMSTAITEKLDEQNKSITHLCTEIASLKNQGKN